MANQGFLLASVLFSCLVAACYGVTFSSLQKTLLVTASPTQGQVLKAGKDSITVTWSLNTTVPAGADSTYKTVSVKLCYAPVSQKDRGWRKTVDDLKKDKTCQHDIVTRQYSASGSDNTVTWIVERDVPTATYFVRAYAENSEKAKVAFGQTTDSNKTTNLFQIQSVSGRHVSLDISAVCFSAFSIISLFGFFFVEKRKMKASQQK
ncbi:high-affinity nitrate transporter 3.1-like [Primulina eburnea]|uniref:high-affinity nitrate transporter 3.1-like n=1 Tax=Primulina eburnea TaxID=1245227 RepID=UPI003C6BF18E